MEQSSTPELPTYPKLRPVDPQWIEHQGETFLYLRDPLAMSPMSVLIPQQLAPLLALCDGTRDLAALQVGLSLRTGLQLSQTRMGEILEQLDSALLLSNGAYAEAADRALRAYREAEFRAPSRAGTVYPADAESLTRELDRAYESVTADPVPGAPPRKLTGVVSPHIDFERGISTYAQLWRRAAPMLADVELVVIFGTDHSGGSGALTPTRQSYATPFGVLPTETDIVDGLADVIGVEEAYAEEMHHVNEHSIELALVWLHHAVGGRPVPVVPMLCGSFHDFTTGAAAAESDPHIAGALDHLRQVTADRRTLVIAAGDLAHVGPVFNDRLPLDTAAKAKLRTDDAASLADICRGDATALLERSIAEGDSRRLCGLPPIYMMLRLLGTSVGEHVAYDQCPADPNGGSTVSIAGALLYEPP